MTNVNISNDSGTDYVDNRWTVTFGDMPFQVRRRFTDEELHNGTVDQWLHWMSGAATYEVGELQHGRGRFRTTIELEPA